MSTVQIPDHVARASADRLKEHDRANPKADGGLADYLVAPVTDLPATIDRTVGEAIPSLRTRLAEMLIADDDLENIPDPIPLVDNLVALDSTVAIFGQYGSGKTFVSMSIAYSVGLGRDFQGRLTSAGPVLYVAAEGQAGLKKRRRAYRKHYGITEPANVTWLAGTVDMLSPTTVAALADIAAELKPKLIVLDTLARLSPGGKEDAEDMGQFIAAMDTLRAATGACVAAVHHSGKDQGRGARGHSSFAGAMDTMLEVSKQSGGRISVLVTKQKDFDSEDETLRFTLEPVAGTDSVVAVPDYGSTSSAEITTAQTVALDTFMSIAVEAGVTSREWLKSLPENAMAERTFWRARAALVTLGLVEERKGRYFMPEPDEV